MKAAKYFRKGARNLAISTASSRAASVSETSLQRQSSASGRGVA